MPELAKPAELFGTSLKEQRSSKSPTVPLVQIRKVLPLAGFSGVVWPVIAPSLTNQSLGWPSQPERFLPLKILSKPASVSAAVRGAAWASSIAMATRQAEFCKRANFWELNLILDWKAKETGSGVKGISYGVQCSSRAILSGWPSRRTLSFSKPFTSAV